MQEINLINKKINALHLSNTSEHFSPGFLINLARKVLGSINLDPFSNARANEYIQAEKYFGLDNKKDGFKEPWGGREYPTNLWINPPGSKIKGKSQQKMAWQYLMEQYEIGNVKSAIFLSFNLNLMQSSQIKQEGKLPMTFAFCVPKQRIAYLKSDLSSSSNPTHPSALFYINPKNDVSKIQLFKEVFSSIGHVIIPSN